MFDDWVAERAGERAVVEECWWVTYGPFLRDGLVVRSCATTLDLLLPLPGVSLESSHDVLAGSAVGALRRGEVPSWMTLCGSGNGCDETLGAAGLDLVQISIGNIRSVVFDSGDRLDCILGDDFAISYDEPDDPADHVGIKCPIHDSWGRRHGDGYGQQASAEYVIELSRPLRREPCACCAAYARVLVEYYDDGQQHMSTEKLCRACSGTTRASRRGYRRVGSLPPQP